MFAYLLGLIAGLAQPLQTSLNGKLREKVRSPFVTSLVSFAMSVLLLIVIVLCVEKRIFIPFGEIIKMPPWIWCGGLCGVGIVILSVICLPRIGSAMTVVLTSFGQMMISLIVDQFGLFDSPRITLTLTRFVGACIVIAGVIIVSRDPDRTGEKQHYPLLYIVLAFIAGTLCGTQIGINGTLGNVAGSPWVATLISMSVGLIGTAVLTLAVFAVKGRSGVFQDGPEIPFKWYMIFGGWLGVVIVGTNAITSPVIGTGMASIMNLIGFMIGGLVIDATGFLGIDVKPVTAAKITGIIAMIAGTVIITLL